MKSKQWSVARTGIQPHDLPRSYLAGPNQQVCYAGSHQDGLMEEEIYGNMFVFNFVGHGAMASYLALAYFCWRLDRISRTGLRTRSISY